MRRVGHELRGQRRTVDVPLVVQQHAGRDVVEDRVLRRRVAVGHRDRCVVHGADRDRHDRGVAAPVPVVDRISERVRPVVVRRRRVGDAPRVDDCSTPCAGRSTPPIAPSASSASASVSFDDDVERDRRVLERRGVIVAATGTWLAGNATSATKTPSLWSVKRAPNATCVRRNRRGRSERRDRLASDDIADRNHFLGHAGDVDAGRPFAPCARNAVWPSAVLTALKPVNAPVPPGIGEVRFATGRHGSVGIAPRSHA